MASALAATYHQLGFQTLADQVRRSVRSVRGNQWMFRVFRVGHPSDHPLRIRRELLTRSSGREGFPRPGYEAESRDLAASARPGAAPTRNQAGVCAG